MKSFTKNKLVLRTAAGFFLLASFYLLQNLGNYERSAFAATTYSISGKVFNDANKNGTLDSGETGRSGVTVRLKDDDDKKDLAPPQTTDSNGDYSFSGLSKGDYRIKMEIPQGCSSWNDNSSRQNVPPSVVYNFSLNCTSAPPPPSGGGSSISGKVFNDANKNEILDSGETGRSGVTVKLRDINDTKDLAAPQTTNSNGDYSFGGLSAGNYRTKMEIPSGCSKMGDNSVTNSLPPSATRNFGLDCVAPTLSTTISASPNSGNSPLGVTLSSSISGSASGTINYSFWLNCSSATTSVATAESVCGALPSPSSGNCSSNSTGVKCLAISSASYSTSTVYYTSAGTSRAKVIAERGSAPPAQAQADIRVSSPPPGVIFEHDFGIYALAPTVSNITVTQPNYCLSGPAATINWNYSDPAGSPQSAYQVQVDDQGGFSNPEIDSGEIFCGSCRTYSTPQGILQFNTTYRARVRVWNQNDVVSDWVVSNTWKTPNNAYPQVNFSFASANPGQQNLIPNSPVQFTDQTIFYDSNPNGRSWNWLFGDGGSSTQQNPQHTFGQANSYNVTLTATDNQKQSCSITKPINIQVPNPIWKEVNPGG